MALPTTGASMFSNLVNRLTTHSTGQVAVAVAPCRSMLDRLNQLGIWNRFRDKWVDRLPPQGGLAGSYGVGFLTIIAAGRLDPFQYRTLGFGFLSTVGAEVVFAILRIYRNDWKEVKRAEEQGVARSPNAAAAEAEREERRIEENMRRRSKRMICLLVGYVLLGCSKGLAMASVSEILRKHRAPATSAPSPAPMGF